MRALWIAVVIVFLSASQALAVDFEILTEYPQLEGFVSNAQENMADLNEALSKLKSAYDLSSEIDCIGDVIKAQNKYAQAMLRLCQKMQTMIAESGHDKEIAESLAQKISFALGVSSANKVLKMHMNPQQSIASRINMLRIALAINRQTYETLEEAIDEGRYAIAY